jgi:hypothetical protein
MPDEPSEEFAHTTVTAAKQLRIAEPDLEVVVGSEENQQIFRYHSVILASYSDYIDTMLSSPMRERTTRRITFPDIEPSTWIKLMRSLETGGSRELNADADLLELLPFYDKYGFHGAIDMCDDIIHDIIDGYLRGRIRLCGDPDRNLNDLLVDFATATCQFNLPQSKRRGIEYAKKRFERELINDKSHIPKLLPLIQDEEVTLKFVVCTILGRKEATTIEKMRKVTQEDSFPSDFLLRIQQISDQDEIITHLRTMDHIAVEGAGSSAINGEYRRRYPSDLRRLGAMKQSFVMSTTWNGRVANTYLEAMEPFGRTWEISVVPVDDWDDLSEEESREAKEKKAIVLYRWDSDFSSFLVPPCRGWVAVEQHGELPAPTLSHKFGY